jgi:hypothetical protein
MGFGERVGEYLYLAFWLERCYFWIIVKYTLLVLKKNIWRIKYWFELHCKTYI